MQNGIQIEHSTNSGLCETLQVHQNKCVASPALSEGYLASDLSLLPNTVTRLASLLPLTTLYYPTLLTFDWLETQ